MTYSLFGASYPGAGQFELSGELIYFKPQIDQPFYVFSSNSATNFTGERFENDITFSPGFRVELAYGFCDCYDDISLRYTFLDADSTRTITGSRLVLTNLVADSFDGSIENDLDIQYQAADLLYGHHFCCSPMFEFAVRGGLHFAYLDVENKSIVRPDNFRVLDDTTSYGIGPQAGIQGGYRFACMPCLSFNGSVHGGLLANHHDVRLKRVENNGQEPTNVKDEEIWRVVPFNDIRTGLSYDFCFCSCGFSLEIGYEFLVYWKSVYNIRVEPVGTDPTSVSIYSDISFHGPYLNLAVRF